MKKQEEKNIEVWADWFDLESPQKVGVLSAFVNRGKETFVFEYNDTWLKGRFGFQLDPNLQLFEGKQYTPHDQPNFGVFLDSSPDRWGRTLLQRREALLAKQEKRPLRHLAESDYLLGVYDAHRVGGFRFKYETGPFLDDQKENAAPPWASLRELQEASLNLENADNEESSKVSAWLKLLVVPGSTLGGSRPKASIVDPKQNLWVAKFPSRDDSKDVGAWEAVVYMLAKKCGISVPEFALEKFSGKHHTFLSKRFDRIGSQQRIHFASAMTWLQRADGDSAATGANYLELVDFIIGNGAKINRDLEELWKRIIFFICISNSDDHLRNHGFILSKRGWELSPAYDMNPNEFATGLCLNISETSNALDIDLALSVAEFFRIKKNRAEAICKKIKKEVAEWRSCATKFKISKSEQDRMATAFRVR